MENKKRLNIVMFGHKHMMSREGGIEVVVREIATRMRMRGHNVICYDRKTRHVSGGILDNRREFDGVKIIPVWTIERRGLAAVTSSLSAAWKAGRSKADVVHVHAEGPAAMCWFLKMKGKRVIVTIHGLDWQRAKWNGWASKYIKFGEKQAVKFADEIIVLSRKTQEYFKKNYSRDTVYIPNGVRKSSAVPADEIRRDWGLESGSYVLFVGRIVPEKGLRYLIEAWKQIKTDKKLVIVGGSSDTELFMNELEKEADETIVFTGFQQGRKLEELYSNAYLFCLPSDLEGMPLSLLEAMSYGNCCVVSDIPECMEVVEDKAISFKHGNVDGLREALQRCIDNPDIVEQKKISTLQFVTEKYSWDEVVDRTIEVYRR